MGAQVIYFIVYNFALYTPAFINFKFLKMMYKCFMIAVLAPFAQLHCSSNKKDDVTCLVDSADSTDKTVKAKHDEAITEAFCTKYFQIPGTLFTGKTAFNQTNVV